MKKDLTMELAALTSREREILKLTAEGLSANQIAHLLNISTSTISTHRRSIHSKLNVSNIAGMVRYAIKFKLIS